MAQACSDGSTVASDGTRMDTYLKQPAVRDDHAPRQAGRHRLPRHLGHVRGAVHARHPVRVREAAYIIEGLLKNTSELKPSTVHADTQEQSFPVFALAHLPGFGLMPRTGNWQDLSLYRPAKQTEYAHIDAVFGKSGRNVIDFDPMESQFRQLTRVAVSVREGAISSTLLLRRPRAGSRESVTCTALREVGRVIRTVQLLRYLSDAPLRRRLTAATDKAKAFNGFSQRIGSGDGGVITDNDPFEQEGAAKFNVLLANAVIFHNAPDIAEIVRRSARHGRLRPGGLITERAQAHRGGERGQLTGGPGPRQRRGSGVGFTWIRFVRAGWGRPSVRHAPPARRSRPDTAGCGGRPR
ncbi:Tn3 family transposase [Streptomyces sp. C11-1]|uniref:Tn3 family transposase n=1 Tax=Streptomyces durocortorensis TaxID=2811104 RepID=A0ABY9VUB3_9ACTN|nr:Tn3 family transposase [Streptomyces durocortorensis]WNF25352.1 Tn3 family transposase [Streptomyces durocortorensis]